jgi:spore germination cell wall hydrolase CwlJ-like protein
MNLITNIVENLSEALDIKQRRERGRQMKRLAPKIARKRKIAMKKKATPEKLMGRARKAAIKVLRNRMLKGKSYESLPAPQRQKIDQRIEKKKSAIEKIAKKLLPKLRKQETERMGGSNKGDN